MNEVEIVLIQVRKDKEHITHNIHFVNEEGKPYNLLITLPIDMYEKVLTFQEGHSCIYEKDDNVKK